mgnify:CR=1 FL=1|jgi:hypothetical protein
MNLRLTPLNIVVALLIVSAAYLPIFPVVIGMPELGRIPLLIVIILCLTTDQVFRRYITELKRIWLIEFLFLIFVALLMLLIKLYIIN